MFGRATIRLGIGSHSSSFFFSLPNISRRRLDVYRTSTHDVALVRKIAIWAPSHKFVGLYLRNYGTCRQSEKNLLSSDISSTCPHNMINFGPLAAEIVSLVWGTPGNFNGFRVLAALVHATLVVGVSQTAAFNIGCHLYSAGRHHVGHWPTLLVSIVFFLGSLPMMLATRQLL